MSMVTGGMGGLGSIACSICAKEGMGPVITTSRTGALPWQQSILFMLEGVMQSSSHISLKGDFSNSNVVCDVFAWCQKMARAENAMQYQVVNIDEINATLSWQAGAMENQSSSSTKSTLELMAWIRDRYATALSEMKKRTESGSTGGMSKKQMEDQILDLKENEKKVGELISEIRSKLNMPNNQFVTEKRLRSIREKAAHLSNAVADIERMSCPVGAKVALENPLKQQQQPLKQQQQTSSPGHQELREQIAQIKNEKGSSDRQWVVVGGGDNGAIIVQMGSEAFAKECEERLATGAKVQEVATRDGKILFEKIEGEGPACGWASITHNGAPLLVEACETELE